MDDYLNTMWLAASAAHWRARAEHLQSILRTAASDTAASDTTPPEPPPGAQVIGNASPGWRRLADGWHCARVDCPNCPAEWAEVWERTASGRDARVVLTADAPGATP